MVEEAELERGRRAAQAAARAAGVRLLGPVPGGTRRPARVEEKAARDYVTEADRANERLIAARLLAEFPGHALLGEELHRAELSVGDVWVVDPVDGTRNLMQGRPEVVVSVGWLRDGAPVAGAIAAPTRDLVLSAARGGAARLGDELFEPPAVRPPELSLVGLPGDFRRPGEGARWATLFARVSEICEGVRVSGALAYDLLCVALGELDGRITLGAKPVDVAAGVCLVRAAGGEVWGLDGAPYVMGAPGLVAARSHALARALLGVCVEAE